jgi:glutamyl-Q tRNA(Asp) synthetase
MYQSRRLEAYERALSLLNDKALLFPCACTRRETVGRIYPGTCRSGLPEKKAARSLRIRLPDAEVCVADSVQGTISQHLATEVGDFIVKRADGQYAYHLAIVVDDARQKISEVVRGADLLESTPRQVFLQRSLELETPAYAHIPLAVDAAGRKLSKQNQAAALDVGAPERIWLSVLRFLGQDPDPQLHDAKATELRDWAIANWCMEKIPRSVAALAAPGTAHARI